MGCVVQQDKIRPITAAGIIITKQRQLWCDAGDPTLQSSNMWYLDKKNYFELFSCKCMTVL